MISNKGILSVQVCSGKFLKDLDLVGAMDPLCQITIGTIVKATRAHKEAGLNAVWNQEFDFQINNNEFNLKATCYDSDGSDRQLIGVGNIDLTPIFPFPNVPHKFKVDIYNSGKPAGECAFIIVFKPVKAQVLKITVQKAIMLTDHDWFNKMDPYVIVEVGSVKKQTSVKQQAGKYPIWNETLTFQIKFTIRDDDGGGKFDECGMATTTLEELMKKKNPVNLPVTLDGSSQGNLQILWAF